MASSHDFGCFRSRASSASNSLVLATNAFINGLPGHQDRQVADQLKEDYCAPYEMQLINDNLTDIQWANKLSESDIVLLSRVIESGNIRVVVEALKALSLHRIKLYFNENVNCPSDTDTRIKTLKRIFIEAINRGEEGVSSILLEMTGKEKYYSE